jgi:hypothetical protein
MRKIILSFFFVLALTAVGKVSFAQALYFNIINNTGETLNNIYVTPAEQNDWGKDILPEDLFNDQTTVRVDIPEGYGTTCLFDLKITDLNGDAVEFRNIDACKLLNLTLHWDGTYEVQNE